MIRRPCSAKMFAFGAAVLMACGYSDTPAETGSRVTEIRIDESEITASRWTLGPAAALEGSATEAFSGITHMARRTATEVLVVDHGPRLLAVRVDGSTRSIGGAGEGPGEFRGVDALQVVDDNRIRVVDFRTQRVTELDSLGAVLVERPTRLPGAMEFRFTTGGDVLAAIPELPTHFTSGYQRVPLRIELHASDTIVEWSAPIPGAGWTFAQTDGSQVTPCPYSHRPVWEPMGKEVVTVSPHGWALDIYSLDGALRHRIVRPDLVAAAPTEAQWARAEREWRTSRSGPAAAAYERENCPDATVPLISRILIDRDGLIWVGSDAPWRSSAPARWEVFSAAGDWLAVLEPTTDVVFQQIGRDEVLAVRIDDLGRHWPIVLPLQRSEHP